MRGLGVFEWLMESCVEPAFEHARALVATLYFVLAVVASLEVVNPNATERISSQLAGRTLFAVLAGLLCSLAVLGIADVVFRRPRGVIEPGAADALLHFGLALWVLDLSTLWHPMSAPGASISHAAIGFCLIFGGSYRLFRIARPSPTSDYARPGREHEIRRLARRDGWARGSTFIVMGALSLAGMVVGTRSADATRELLCAGLYAVGTLALLAYALHAVWTLGEDDRSWAV